RGILGQVDNPTIKRGYQGVKISRKIAPLVALFVVIGKPSHLHKFRINVHAGFGRATLGKSPTFRKRGKENP
ncbi:MAG: hypothetical protein KC588_19325, partial [Nitrospira sp.]|nr:hypothetical protein [Nitrospira sp.]